MKINLKGAFVLLLSSSLIWSCGDDSEDSKSPQPTGNSKTYDLAAYKASGVSGTAKFAEYDDNSVTVTLSLNGTPNGGSHPAHIHFNTAAEGGDIALTLGTVDGSTGESTINFTTLDDGTVITYDELIDFDGYINVHLSADDLTIVAQGDIGQNELTGASVSYDLDERGDFGVSGTVAFNERVNGEALAVISLSGATAGNIHPAHIHENDAAEGGAIAFTFNAIDGATGISRTNVSSLDSGADFGYDDVKTFDGYVNIHFSSDDLTIVAQGNIGSNEDVDEVPPAISYDVTNSGATAYIFNGNGLSNASNPDFTFKRGETYVFNVSTPGHPFLIKSVQSTGTSNTYDEGVTNNGASSGTITFTVPNDAPNTLFYNCEFHGSMTGTITITD